MKARELSLGSMLAVSMFFSASPAHALTVDVTIPESYATVRAGDRLYFQTDIAYPQDIGIHDFKISYEIKEGTTVIASSQFYKAIETQASFVDYTIVPLNAKAGLHTIDITIMDDSGNVIASDVSSSFTVVPQLDWLSIYFWIILATIITIGVVIFFELRIVEKEVERR